LEEGLHGFDLEVRTGGGYMPIWDSRTVLDLDEIEWIGGLHRPITSCCLLFFLSIRSSRLSGQNWEGCS